jgi:hypothetical protein
MSPVSVARTFADIAAKTRAGTRVHARLTRDPRTGRRTCAPPIVTHGRRESRRDGRKRFDPDREAAYMSNQKVGKIQ